MIDRVEVARGEQPLRVHGELDFEPGAKMQ